MDIPVISSENKEISDNDSANYSEKIPAAELMIKIKSPICLHFKPPSALRQRIHISNMLLLMCLDGDLKSGASMADLILIMDLKIPLVLQIHDHLYKQRNDKKKREDSHQMKKCHKRPVMVFRLG